jgi:hypothetical protein
MIASARRGLRNRVVGGRPPKPIQWFELGILLVLATAACTAPVGGQDVSAPGGTGGTGGKASGTSTASGAGGMGIILTTPGPEGSPQS